MRDNLKTLQLAQSLKLSVDEGERGENKTGGKYFPVCSLLYMKIAILVNLKAAFRQENSRHIMCSPKNFKYLHPKYITRMINLSKDTKVEIRSLIIFN